MKPIDSDTTVVKVLYFARLREAFSRGDEELVLPEGVADVGTLAAFLQRRGGVWASELGKGRAVRAAVNQEMADASTSIGNGDEIAFFPPVTGG